MQASNALESIRTGAARALERSQHLLASAASGAHVGVYSLIKAGCLGVALGVMGGMIPALGVASLFSDAATADLAGRATMFLIDGAAGLLTMAYVARYTDPQPSVDDFTPSAR